MNSRPSTAAPILAPSARHANGKDERPKRRFQFRLDSLFAVTVWVAIVLAAWRSGLLQPTLMPFIFPLVAAIGVKATLIVARRLRHSGG